MDYQQVIARLEKLKKELKLSQDKVLHLDDNRVTISSSASASAAAPSALPALSAASASTSETRANNINRLKSASDAISSLLCSVGTHAQYSRA